MWWHVRPRRSGTDSIGSTAGGGSGRTTSFGRDAHEATSTSGMSARYFSSQKVGVELLWPHPGLVYDLHRTRRLDRARCWFCPHRRTAWRSADNSVAPIQPFGGRRGKLLPTRHTNVETVSLNRLVNPLRINGRTFCAPSNGALFSDRLLIVPKPFAPFR